jgi:DNA-binding transcriptional MerR regulator
MRIGELADKAGVSVRALRYYEEQHLLTSERSPSGQRHYPATAVAQVRIIQEMYRSGLASKAIAEILPSVMSGPVTPDLLGRLEAQRARLDAQISGLQTVRDRLDAGIRQAIAHAAASRTPCPLD